MSEQYHLAELKIARDPAHPAHILPPPLPEAKVVLDVGCGAGQTLIAAFSGRACFGLDIDEDALRLGLTLTDRVHFACGRAEALPWTNGHFDLVIARVSLCYADIQQSLLEFRRVLRDDGRVWITLHPFSFCWEKAKNANLKGWLYFGYIVINSLLFRFAQRQFSLRGRCESFQTEAGMKKALKKAGFEIISISRGRHFAVFAKPR